MEFNYDEEKKEGNFLFNGYWYVEEDKLPLTYYMRYYKTAYPPRIEKSVENGCYTERHFFKYYEHFEFEGELCKREKIKNTNEYSTIDDDGDEMDVCFFPTDIQRIWFHVKKVIGRIQNEEPKEFEAQKE
jgi:hypothetical protein